MLLAFASTESTAAVALLLSGIGFGVTWPGFQTLIATVVPVELRQRYFGVNFTLLNLGIGIGGIVGGMLVDVERLATFQIDLPRRRGELPARAVPDGGAAAARRRPARAPRGRRRPRRSSYLAVARRPAVATLMLLSFVSSYVGYSQLNAGMPAFARAVGEISTRGLGLAFAANTLVIVVLQLFVLQRIEGRRRTRVIAVMGVVWAGSWLLLGETGLRVRHRRRDPAGRGLRVGVRVRRDAAPADHPGAGQRARARPPARSLQRAQLRHLPARGDHRPAGRRADDRPRPRRALHRLAGRRLPAVRRDRGAQARAAAQPGGQRRPEPSGEPQAGELPPASAKTISAATD